MMSSGFSSIKDILDVVVIPVVLAILAFVWPMIQSSYRCRRFKLLARRELEEIGPHRAGSASPASWRNLLTKSLVHRQIVEDASEHRDFLLGLDPDFVYSLLQLWSAYENDQPAQWLYFMEKLSEHRYSKSPDLTSALEEWKEIIRST